ncbi:MAG: dUTP diphosphatase [Bacteroidales bacterium]|nr:dUTP diphosphatase [Bacteroidales bacterium]
MKVKIVNKSGHDLPRYATKASAGLDLRANINGYTVVGAGERALISTGLFIELPEGFEAQIRPRSGLAIKSGISILNSPGTIDADYRGEIKIILINHSKENFIINDGDRICQMVIQKVEQAEWQEVSVLEHSDRGDGGFGHSGKI